MDDFFTETSDKPYDRHLYKLILDTNSEIIFDDYMKLREYWMLRKGSHCLRVEVLDKDKPKIKTKKSVRGFG